MTRFLTFSIVAPLAAFGALAVGERRPSWDRPGKSAALGLLAAALGIERSDETAHQALARSFLFAAREETRRARGEGALMIDFHTAQSAPQRRGRRFFTRREELAVDDCGTILTRREYRADVFFSLAFWLRGSAARWSLEELAAALREPAFTLYVGRKACPLMAPTDPRIIEAQDVFEAFARRDGLRGGDPKLAAFLARRGLDARPRMVALDAEAGCGGRAARLERRRDAPIDRGRWQFGTREELVADWPQEDAR